MKKMMLSIMKKIIKRHIKVPLRVFDKKNKNNESAASLH